MKVENNDQEFSLDDCALEDEGVVNPYLQKFVAWNGLIYLEPYPKREPDNDYWEYTFTKKSGQVKSNHYKCVVTLSEKEPEIAVTITASEISSFYKEVEFAALQELVKAANENFGNHFVAVRDKFSCCLSKKLHSPDQLTKEFIDAFVDEAINPMESLISSKLYKTWRNQLEKVKSDKDWEKFNQLIGEVNAC